MAKILVLYHSCHGHVETMAEQIAAGAREAGATVDIRRVAETVPEEAARRNGYKLDQPAPLASVEELPGYDAIVVGCGTRYGRMPSQLTAFLDRTGGLWASGALTGKVGAAFACTASQHGGQEATLLSILTNLLHFGMTIVGLDYGFKPQMGLDAVLGGSPYGATTLAGGDGRRAVHELEQAGARYLGRRVAETAARLAN